MFVGRVRCNPQPHAELESCRYCLGSRLVRKTRQQQSGSFSEEDQPRHYDRKKNSTFGLDPIKNIQHKFTVRWNSGIPVG